MRCHRRRCRTPLGFSYLYTGQRFDAETGLYYYKNRYYEPQNGRFLSRDPIGYADGPSLYQYARSNPAIFVDPLGLTVYVPGIGKYTCGLLCNDSGSGDEDKVRPSPQPGDSWPHGDGIITFTVLDVAGNEGASFSAVSTATTR